MPFLDLPETVLTDRLILERLKYEDAEEIFYTYASKSEATRFVSFQTHRSVDDTRSFLRYAIPAWNEKKDFTYAVRLKESHRLIGSIGIMNKKDHVQFGYIFSPTQWNQGYATETCRRILALLAEQHIERVSTIVDVDNTASVRVLEKCGLQKESVQKGMMKFPNQDFQAKDCFVFRK
jgi:[ribosomal protein S5]-alanine N-acetyltransferase